MESRKQFEEEKKSFSKVEVNPNEEDDTEVFYNKEFVNKCKISIN